MRKLNGLELISWADADNRVSFVLKGNVLSEAAALDGQTFTVTEDDEQVKVYDGYQIMSVSLEGTNTVIRCFRKLNDSTEDALAGLDANVKSLENRVSTVEKSTTNLSDAVSNVSESVNPEVITFAKMAIPTMTISMTTTEVCSVVSLLPEWKVGESYEQHETFTYEGKVYRAAQKIPEAQEIYKPGQGTESLYTLIDIADDGVRVWKMPTDATNSFALGERAHYPTASSPIYVSQRDGNTSVPGTDEWWVLEK